MQTVIIPQNGLLQHSNFNSCNILIFSPCLAYSDSTVKIDKGIISHRSWKFKCMIKISTRAANRLRFRWFLVTDRYLHIKSTALSKLAFCPDFAVVSFRDRFDNR